MLTVWGRSPFDFRAAVIDEIALEGLDGITLEGLWRRLHERPHFTFPLDDYGKRYLWGLIKESAEVEFFKLPVPRNPLVIFNRFDYVDPDIGTVLEPEEKPEDLYPYVLVNDKVNHVKGSCQYYKERENVTKIVIEENLSLEDALDRWGMTLVVVASQDVREHTLVGLNTDPLLPMAPTRYCILERIGRSRYLGEVTQGKISLQLIGEDAKTLFYHRKFLTSNGLITKQIYHQKQGKMHCSGSLLHLPRFFIERKSKTLILTQQIVKLLKSRPNCRADYEEIRREIGIPTTLKKLFKTAEFQRFIRTDLKLSYRTMYPTASIKEWRHKGKDKEKIIRAIELIDPDLDENEIWIKDEDGEQEQDTSIDVERVSLLYDRPLLYQAFYVVDKAGSEGMTQMEISLAMGVNRLQSRTICRNLLKLGIVSTYFVDVGRQRVAKYMSKRYITQSKLAIEFNNEKKKLFALIESGKQSKSALKKKRLSDVKTKLELKKAAAKAAGVRKEKEEEVKKEQQTAEEDNGGNLNAISTDFIDLNAVKVTPSVQAKASVVEQPVHTIGTEIYNLKVCGPGITEELKKPNMKKDTPSITYRILKRANFIIQAVQTYKVIDDVTKLMRMINEEEEKEGLSTKMDKKSLLRILIKLNKDKHLKFIKVSLKSGEKEKILNFVCDMSITQDHPLILTAIEQHKLKFFFIPKDKLPKPNPAIPPPLPSKKIGEHYNSDLIWKSSEELKAMTSREKNDRFVYDRLAGKKYGYCPKFIRLREIHQFLYYLVYEYAGKEGLDQTEAVTEIRASGVDLSDEEVAELPTMYLKELSWKTFVPPLPQHGGWPEGWTVICDVLLRLPLSIFVRCINVTYNVPDLEAYLNHPTRKYYLIKCLPTYMRNNLLVSRKYIFSFHEIVSRLCYMGLAQFGSQRMKDKDQVSVYLNRHTSVLDTMSSRPGYHQVSEDIQYLKHEHEFRSSHDVDKYWYDLWNICLNTQLGGRLCMSGQDIILEVLVNKKAMIDAVQQRTPEEALANDNGTIPGDHRGAAGLDSAIFSHLKRNWNWTNSHTKAEDIRLYMAQIKPQPENQRMARIASLKPQPVRFDVLLGAQAMKGSPILNIRGSAKEPKEKEIVKDAKNLGKNGQELEQSSIGSEQSMLRLKGKTKEPGKSNKETKKISKDEKSMEGTKREHKKKETNENTAESKENTTAADVKRTRVKKVIPATPKAPKVVAYRRRILPRKRQNAPRKPFYDEIDKQAQKAMTSWRVQWFEEEDNLLLLCKVASMFICPNPRKQFIGFTAIRDILHQSIPLSLNKTSRACQRRITYMMKNLSTSNSLTLHLEEVKQDEYLMKIFGNTLQEARAVTEDYNAQEERICQRFKELVSILKKKFSKVNLLRNIPQNKFCSRIPDTMDEVLAKYDMCNPSSLKTKGKFQDVKSVTDIMCSIVNATIHSTLCCATDKRSYMYQLFKIYQQYTDSLMRSVMAKIRIDQMVSAKKSYAKLLHRTGNYLPVSSMPYQLSITYYYLLQSKYNFEVYHECHLMKERVLDFFKDVIVDNIDEAPECNEEERAKRKKGMECLSVDGGAAACLVEWYLRGNATLDLKIPENIVILDPRVEKKDEAYKKIVSRYQEIIKSCKLTSSLPPTSTLFTTPFFINSPDNPSLAEVDFEGQAVPPQPTVANMPTDSDELVRQQPTDSEGSAMAVNCRFKLDRDLLRRCVPRNLGEDSSDSEESSEDEVEADVVPTHVSPTTQYVIARAASRIALFLMRDSLSSSNITELQHAHDFFVVNACQVFCKLHEREDIEEATVNFQGFQYNRASGNYIPMLHQRNTLVSDMDIETTGHSVCHKLHTQCIVPLTMDRCKEILHNLESQLIYPDKEVSLDDVRKVFNEHGANPGDWNNALSLIQWVRAKKDVGATMKELREQFPHLAGDHSLARLLKLLTTSQFLLRVGVTTTHYVHRKYRTHWLLSSFRLPRLVREKLLTQKTVNPQAARKRCRSVDGYAEALFGSNPESHQVKKRPRLSTASTHPVSEGSTLEWTQDSVRDGGTNSVDAVSERRSSGEVDLLSSCSQNQDVIDSLPSEGPHEVSKITDSVTPSCLSDSEAERGADMESASMVQAGSHLEDSGQERECGKCFAMETGQSVPANMPSDVGTVLKVQEDGDQEREYGECVAMETEMLGDVGTVVKVQEDGDRETECGECVAMETDQSVPANISSDVETVTVVQVEGGREECREYVAIETGQSKSANVSSEVGSDNALGDTGARESNDVPRTADSDQTVLDSVPSNMEDFTREVVQGDLETETEKVLDAVSSNMEDLTEKVIQVDLEGDSDGKRKAPVQILEQSNRPGKRLTFRDMVDNVDWSDSESIQVTIRPWVRIDGTLNRRVLDRMLGSVLGHCLCHPGVSIQQVMDRFSPALQPFQTRQLLEILESLDCLKFQIVQKAVKPSLFSKVSQVCVVDADGTEDESQILIKPSVDAIMRLGTFIGDKAYKKDFMENPLSQ